jgi:hypothetical protein
MVRLQTLDLRIGVRVPASQPLPLAEPSAVSNRPMLKELKLMRFCLLLLACTTLLPAQQAGKLFRQAPAGLDDVVRARVTEYFKLQMEGKFRQAESLVCEVSKDAYYDMEKTRWKSFELVSTSYEDDFRTGNILVALGTDLATPFGMIDATYPYVSIWKLQEGKWCFYIDPDRDKERRTPFGVMKGGAPRKEGAAPTPLFASPEQILETFERGVRVQPDRVLLPAKGKGTAEVTIENALPGPVVAEITGAKIPGLEAVLAATRIEGNSKTTLRITSDPAAIDPGKTLEIEVTVNPGGRTFVIPVALSGPEQK